MATTTYSSLSQRTTAYAEAKALSHAEPILLFDKFGQTKPLPKNKAEQVKFRRPVPFAVSTTQLTEGVTPTAQAMSYEDVPVTLGQYGAVTEITDKVNDLAEDPVLNDAMTLSGEQAAETKEMIAYGVVKAGTNVLYANGSARSAVNTAIAIGLVRKAVRQLKSNRAKFVTRMIGSSVNYNTTPVAPAFVAFSHSDVQADIEALPGFKRVEEYGSTTKLLPYEIGKVGEIRFCVSPLLTAFADAGGTAGGMISTTGTNADVYPIIVIGAEAYGHVPLKGAGSLTPRVINPDVIDKSDPLGQRGYVSWKCYYACVRLNESWMLRLEVAATANPTA